MYPVKLFAAIVAAVVLLLAQSSVASARQMSPAASNGRRRHRDGAADARDQRPHRHDQHVHGQLLLLILGEPQHFLCSLDGASPTLCSSSKTVHGLADGQHTFQVWAIGPDGQQDPTGVSWTFTAQTAPTADSSPSLSSHNAQVGQTVTCDSGTWSGQPTISYLWYSNGTPITDPQPSGAYTP